MYCWQGFSKVLTDNMLNNLLQKRLLQHSQHEFLPRRSCFSAILTFINDTIYGVDDHDLVNAHFLDLSKAFDSIPHMAYSLV